MVEWNIRPEEFFELTPSAFSLLITFRGDVGRSKQVDLQATAWHIANYGNAKKLPSLKKILKGKGRVKTKSELAAILDQRKVDHERILKKFGHG